MFQIPSLEQPIMVRCSLVGKSGCVRSARGVNSAAKVVPTRHGWVAGMVLCNIKLAAASAQGHIHYTFFPPQLHGLPLSYTNFPVASIATPHSSIETSLKTRYSKQLCLPPTCATARRTNRTTILTHQTRLILIEALKKSTAVYIALVACGSPGKHSTFDTRFSYQQNNPGRRK